MRSLFLYPPKHCEYKFYKEKERMSAKFKKSCIPTYSLKRSRHDGKWSDWPISSIESKCNIRKQRNVRFRCGGCSVTFYTVASKSISHNLLKFGISASLLLSLEIITDLHASLAFSISQRLHGLQ